MDKKDFTIRVEGRGEEIVYADAQGEVWIDRSATDQQRLHCNSICGPGRTKLPFGRRREIIIRLCESLNTKRSRARFVIDERDPDRWPLQALVAELAAQGHQVSVEHDSAEKRERQADEMFGRILQASKQAGKTFRLNGKEIKSIEDYQRWKRER